MRYGILGAGLAGSLLAWRVSANPDVSVALAIGPRRLGATDATRVSGGAVRGFEEHPGQRALAIASLVELLASPTLRVWSRFRPAPTLIVDPSLDGLNDAVEEINRALPGTARIWGAEELRNEGWRGTRAVHETGGGRINPDALRTALLRQLGRRPNVSIAETIDGADVTVHATGAWTKEPGYRTKAIRYSVFENLGWRPPIFSSGLFYGIPLGGELLLGKATDEWDVDPARVPESTVDFRDVHPRLRLGRLLRTVAAADCYTEPPILALRQIADDVFVFSGGSGASAKTALAASAKAAHHLQEVTRVAH